MGVAASSMPAESELETRARNILPEMMEEILLHLPLKSLLRFSTVSKAWHCMIFNARFVQRHRSCSRAVTIATIARSGIGAFTRPLSSIYRNQIIGDDGEPLICPFYPALGGYFGSLRPRLLASCDELWCTEYVGTLFLWNPSMRTFQKLPFPSVTRPNGFLFWDLDFCFGVGYDSVGDDYKILKFSFREYSGEVYSLQSDTWKQTEPFPGELDQRLGRGGVAASGALHWLARARSAERERVIISFDLSEEKYAVVPVPQTENYYDAELSVSREKLCVALNYTSRGALGVYVMQEYGVGKSWVKIFEFNFSPLTARLSHDESGVIGLRGLVRDARTLICIYAGAGKESRTVFHCDDDYTCHLYAESLVSPATYCRRRQQPVYAGNHLRKRSCALVFLLLIIYLCNAVVIFHFTRVMHGLNWVIPFINILLYISE